MTFSLKNKRAILFDMDGVLYNSMPIHAKAWVQAMKDFGVIMTPSDVYMNEGCTGSYTVKTISMRECGYELSDDDVLRIYARKAEIFRSFPPAEIMPGAQELFRKASDAGFKILVVTGSGQKNLIARVLKDFDGYITRDMMVTSFDVKRGKPFPDPYLKGLELSGVCATQAVVVENAPMGIRASVTAGIETIAVNTGPLPDECLKNEGCVALFPSMQSLSDNWDNMFI